MSHRSDIELSFVSHLLEHRKYMTNAFINSDSIASSLIADGDSLLPSLGAIPSSADQAERVISCWLAQLLKHFSVQKLDAASDQEIADYLATFAGDETLNSACELPSYELVAELRRRVMRLAGAHLDDAFVSMTPDIVDEADIVSTFLCVEGRRLHGLRYQGEVYRKVKEFQPCHRLQSYCLAQTFKERQIPYIITRSEQRFAVWVQVCAFPSASQML